MNFRDGVRVHQINRAAIGGLRGLQAIRNHKPLSGGRWPGKRPRAALEGKSVQAFTIDSAGAHAPACHDHRRFRRQRHVELLGTLDHGFQWRASWRMRNSGLAATTRLLLIPGSQ